MQHRIPQEAIDRAREVAIRTGSTRPSVEAAAPLIAAAALETEADRIHSTIQAWGYGPNDDPPANSAAAAYCDVAVDLRERASALRGDTQLDCPKCLRPSTEHTTDECPPPL
jgi:hypothetical protein